MRRGLTINNPVLPELITESGTLEANKEIIVISNIKIFNLPYNQTYITIDFTVISKNIIHSKNFDIYHEA